MGVDEEQYESYPEEENERVVSPVRLSRVVSVCRMEEVEVTTRAERRQRRRARD